MESVSVNQFTIVTRMPDMTSFSASANLPTNHNITEDCPPPCCDEAMPYIRDALLSRPKFPVKNLRIVDIKKIATQHTATRLSHRVLSSTVLEFLLKNIRNRQTAATVPAVTLEMDTISL